LAITDSRIFSSPFTVLLAEQLVTDVDLAERVDAFVSTFGDLQDNLGDKLLPLLLKLLGERQGVFVDNPSRTV